QGGGYAAALEIDPLRIGHAVQLAHFPEGAAEPPRARERPVVIQKRVAELMQDQPGELIPGDLVAAPLPGHVAPLDLDDLGGPVRHAGYAGTQQHAVVPVLDPAHDEQLPHPAQGLADQIASRGVFPAPGTDVHPVVHTLAAVRADVLKFPVVPFLRTAAPRAEAHRIHHAAAAAPATPPMVAEPLWRLEGLRARVRVGDVAPAPGAEREGVRHDPAAVIALGARLLRRVPPLEPPAAVGAIRPEALELGGARRAAQLRRRHLPTARPDLSHGRAPAPHRRYAG